MQNRKALYHVLARGHGVGDAYMWHFYKYGDITLAEFTAKNYTLELN